MFLLSTYHSWIHFFPPHSPTSIQHPLSPWKPLWNDSYLSEWPKLCFIFSPIVFFSFEFLLCLGFCDLVSLSPLRVLSEYLSLCSYPLLPPTFSYIFESFNFFFFTHQLVVLVQGRFETVLYINDLQGLLFSSPDPLICIFYHFLRSQFPYHFIWGAQIRWLLYLLWQTSFHSQGHVYSIVHFHLPFICSCLQLYLNFYWGTSKTVEFRSSFPKDSLSSKFFLLPVLTNTLNNTILFLAFWLIKLKIMLGFPLLPYST